MTADEIGRLLSLFASFGVDKLRVTGGEPTVRRDFGAVIDQIGRVGFNQFAMTTNGIKLKRWLPALQEAGLNGVNISLDTLVEAKFEFITRHRGFRRVLDSMYAALDAGIKRVKINTVVLRGLNDDEILDFVELTRQNPIQVRFIEYMPFDGNNWSKARMVSFKEMLQTVSSTYALHPKPPRVGDTAKCYAVEGHLGSVGFITSMTSSFCSGCNRLRITADGNLKACLFSNEEFSLRSLLRRGASDTELAAAISQAVSQKKREHAGMDLLRDLKNRPMVLIGG